jgi:hypothetical protein
MTPKDGVLWPVGCFKTVSKCEFGCVGFQIKFSLQLKTRFLHTQTHTSTPKPNFIRVPNQHRVLCQAPHEAGA